MFSVWWQGVIFVVACMVGGLLIGLPLGLLIKRLLSKNRGEQSELRGRKSWEKWEKITRPRESVAIVPDAKTESFEEPFSERSEATPAVEESAEPVQLDLLTEVENNRNIATKPWTGDLQPFQTRVWDTAQDEVNKLPANLQGDLAQAYVDMRLANNIVWLATDLGRRTRNLDENYMNLCTSVAARLARVILLLTQSGNKQHKAYTDSEHRLISKV